MPLILQNAQNVLNQIVTVQATLKEEHIENPKVDISGMIVLPDDVIGELSDRVPEFAHGKALTLSRWP